MPIAGWSEGILCAYTIIHISYMWTPTPDICKILIYCIHPWMAAGYIHTFCILTWWPLCQSIREILIILYILHPPQRQPMYMHTHILIICGHLCQSIHEFIIYFAHPQGSLCSMYMHMRNYSWILWHRSIRKILIYCIIPGMVLRYTAYSYIHMPTCGPMCQI